MSDLAMSTATAKAELDAQDQLQPGTEGWWKVWGATPRDIQSGDYVMCKTSDPENPVDEFYIQARNYDSKWGALRVEIVVDGQVNSIGSLATVIILRRGTKSTLAGSVR